MNDSAESSKSRTFALGLGCIALSGLVLRALPLLRGGALVVPGDYDDGVYFTASALLTRGVLPYRDFVFVHPPGVALFYALVSWMSDVAFGFEAARVVAVIVGTLNVILSGVVARRATGGVGGVVAALLYAIYPDAVSAERSVYLEPLLNLFALSGAAFWLRERRRASDAVIAGLLIGTACAVKLLGGIWVVAALIAAEWKNVKVNAARFVAAASAVGIALLAPFALCDLDAFVTQVIRFQLSRPADGELVVRARLAQILGSGHGVATTLAIVALLYLIARLVLRPRDITRAERFFAAATLLTGLAFLASASYWRQYNAFLAASECVLAGIAAGTIARSEALRSRVTSTVVVLAVVIFSSSSFLTTLRDALTIRGELLQIRDVARTTIHGHESLFAFDPTWALAAGHLPR